LTYEAACTLVRRLAEGLHAAHERGIIHRDVAPDNIIIPKGDVGRAKIIDFGIARSTLLHDGTIIGGGFAGKYNYVSPEQLGLFGGNVTATSDIYSLGLVLVEALTGRPIDMGGSQVEIIEKRRKLPDLGGIDVRMRPLLEKMLQPNPADRPESMMAVAHWVPGTPTPASLASRSAAHDGRSATGSRARTSSGLRWSLAALGAVVLIGASLSYYYLVLVPDPPAAVPKPPPLQATLPAKPAPGAIATLSPATSPSPPAATPPPAPPANQATTTRPPALTSPSGAAPPTLSPQPSAGARPNLDKPASPTGPAAGASGPSIPPVATLSPPSAKPTAPPQPGSSGRVDQILNFINNYDGGECFFISPISVGERAARIEGYGANAGAFQVLDDSFKRMSGFEAEIGLRLVTSAQCPAVTFLGQLRGQRAASPRLEIREAELRSGQVLSGSIGGHGNRHVELLLISDDGTVHNLSRLVKTSGDRKVFNLRMQLVNTTGAQPQILMAVTSAQPLRALQVSQGDAAQLFAAARSEAAQGGQTVAAAARYFKLE
jgi:serine/threonine-protein kinase